MKIEKRKENYQPEIIKDCRDMKEEDWLKLRKEGIGGSDVASILNISPWRSSLELFHDKVGVMPKIKKEFNPDAKELGHIFEASVSDMFMYFMSKEHPEYKLTKIVDTNMYRHPKYKFMRADLDYRLQSPVLGNGVLEIKTTSPRNLSTIKKWQEGIVPEYYEVQCRHYMAVTNLQYCFICCAWGLSLDQMAVVFIARDYDIEEKLIKEEEKFWEYVEQGFTPDTSECKPLLINDYYSRLYGKVDESKPIIELPEKYASLVEKAIVMEKKIEEQEKFLDELKGRKEEIFKEFYPIFGDSSFGSCRINDNEVAYITLKTPMKRAKLDEERLKNDHPDVWNKYQKQSFDCTSFSKEEKKLKREYTLPAEVSDDPKKKNTFEIKIKEIPVS